MATTAMVDAYVRQVLHEEHGEDLAVIEGGGYRVPVGDGIRVWVVHGNHRTRRVLITAVLIEDVATSPELLAELNDLNAVTPYGRYFHHDDAVVVEDTLLAEDLDPASLFASIGFVAWAVETQGRHLASSFDTDGGDGQGELATAGVRLQERAGALVDPEAGVAGPTTRTRRGVINAGGYL